MLIRIKYVGFVGQDGTYFDIISHRIFYCGIFSYFDFFLEYMFSLRRTYFNDRDLPYLPYSPNTD